MANRFEGKVAVVTGAAGGIGRATVDRLAREGARIAAVDIDRGALDEVAAGVRAHGSEMLAIPADVTRAEDVRGFLDDASTRFGGVDLLFNNAGIEGVVTPFEEYPEDVFDRVMAVNVRGVFLGLKYALPRMRARGGGAIVNTSSVAGLTGNPLVSAYITSKHAVIGLTRSAAMAGAADGVRVNAVCPAPIETRMMRSLEEGFAPGAPESVKTMMKTRIPLGRYGTPDEIAAVVAFLFSDDARYITGAIYPVDGGMTVG
ncbi:MAG TPA: SDR family NAD(P)-dependent oxidoreductase [Candidatus Binatia bacterium]|nr:SDR family NAD(P)-dependent oxidoreductase [Candidatus Binatia bacterium]